MSSSEAARPRRNLLAAVLMVAALAGGCFQPLYSDYTTSTVGGSVKTALRSIEVPEIKGLIGHNLRNELVFELDGGGESDSPKTLKLEATVAEWVEIVTVDYANGRADSAVLVATVNWKLIQQGSSKVLAAGGNSVRVPYERSSQRFASVRAARDAQIRAAKNLATLVRNQIAAEITS